MLHREVEKCDRECELDCAPHNEKADKQNLCEWGCLLDNGSKLAVGQPNSS